MSRQLAHKILGLFGRLFSEDLRGFRGRGGEEGQRFGEARQAFLRLVRPHRFLPSVFLIITTEGKHPRDSGGGVSGWSG